MSNFLDNTPPAYEPGYFDSLISSYDGYANEPVTVDAPAPTKPALQKNNHFYRLDAFDILARANAEISAIAAVCGIDWNVLSGLINRNQNSYKNNALALNKSYRGKVKAWLDIKLLNNGQEYPVLTFHTLKDGGVTDVFNGYQWLKDNGLVYAKPLSELEAKALETKRLERHRQQAERAERASQQQVYTQEQSIKRFNDFQEKFSKLPALTAVNFADCYLANKKFTDENLTLLLESGFILKRGHDKDGGFIAYELKNNHKTVGFQKIYDQPVVWLNGNKQNIFLPNTKNGSFAILGKPENLTAKIFICEGFATGLSVFLATGKPVIIALDAGNLFHVAKSQSKLFKKLVIATDNDKKECGNTGLYHALITAKAFNLEIVYPELLNGETCDFNDVHAKYGLNKVKSQLKSNKLDFSDSSVYYTLLLQTCLVQNKTDLEKHLKSAFFIAANQLSLNNTDDIKNAALPIQTIIDNRKLTINNEPINAAKKIESVLIRKLFEIKESNSITNLDAVAVKPHYPAKNNLSPTQASEKIQALTDNFFNELSANVAIKASAGVGKTRAVINSLSKINVKGQVHVFVPTHELADNWQDNLKETAPLLKTLHLYGRGGANKNNPFCNRYDQVQQVVDKKLPVFATMCSQNEDICPFFNQCQYIKQFNQNADIVLMPHSYLSLNHSAMELKPAAVVIDERFFTELISSRIYKINDINDLELGDFRFALMSAISKVKAGKIGLFSALKETINTNTNGLIALLNEILESLDKSHNSRSTHGLKPTSGELFFKDCLSKIKNVNTELAIISALLKELERFPEREESQLFRVSNDYYIINSRHTDNRFNYYLKNNIPILIIDADCNEIIINELLNSRIESLKDLLPFSFNEINVKRTAKITQYTNSQFAKSRFFPHGTDKSPDLKRVNSAARTVEKIAAGKQTLLVTYKDLEPVLKELLPSNITILHFGAIRGIDQYKHHDKVIILGRNQPPAHAMENSAAALFFFDAQSIEFSGVYTKQSRQYRGKIELSGQVYSHKDDRVQAILEQSRESELLQAIDRLRFIHATDTEREVHILTDIALDIDVDYFLDSNDILPKGRQALTEIMALNGGILPLSPTFLFNRYPDKFVNIQQVKDDIRQTLKINLELMSDGGKGVISNIYIQQSHHLSYRLSGQKGGHNLTAVFDKDLNPLDVITRLQELHGEPIQVITFNEPTIAPLIEPVIEQLPIEQPPIEQQPVTDFFSNESTIKQIVLHYALHDGAGGVVISHQDTIEDAVSENLIGLYGNRLKQVLYKNAVVYV